MRIIISPAKKMVVDTDSFAVDSLRWLAENQIKSQENLRAFDQLG